ncbi:MAG: zinc-binding dehydrogenase [Mariprofundaceae bacterium]
MRAIVMTRTGGPEVLEIREMPAPTPGPGEVLVRLHAAGVNPIDTKLRARGLYFGEPPAVLGCDGAGVIEAVGEGVSGFGTGDAVWHCFGGLGQRSADGGPAGNDAEAIAVPAAYLARKPESADFPTAAAGPLVIITAWESLFDRARVRPGQQVFIHAGAGGVGHVAVQLAADAGCRVAASVGSAENAAFVRELGAELAINRHEEDIAETLLAWTDGRGVDAALDTVGGEAFKALIPAVAIGGDLVTLLQVPGDADFKTLRLRNIRLSQELMLTPMVLNLADGARRHGRILAEAARMMDEGRLRIELAGTFPLEEAAAAHQRLAAGHMRGKLALTIR